MKIALVHNRYALPGRGSGEEIMIEAIQHLLVARGHQVLPYMRSSLDLQNMTFGSIHAFFSGIYNWREKRQITAWLAREKPDLVLVQNVFPLLSPSILVACRHAGIPVIMRCPNYRLICPNGLLMTNGKVCNKCIGGKEYWCILQNCEKDIFKSAGYALRGLVARQFSLFNHNVDVFMVLTPFARQKLIENGFAPERVHVLSALADPLMFQPASGENPGSYVGFVGRISPEKGVDTLIQAARRLPHLPFKIAGRHDDNAELIKYAPENVEFLGQLDRDALMRFYQDARFIVVPSRWYEGLPVVMIEAMLCAKPIICSRLGGLPDIVDDGITGVLFQPNNIEDLQIHIVRLWDNPVLCRRLGTAGHKKAEDEYNPEAFYQRLMQAYETSLELRKKGNIAA
jgi:glycosyltransferase involved in cell wall biosynthesis